MTKEIWRDVPGYEGLYFVSNLGRVKSSYTKGYLSGRPHQFGYKLLTLRKNKKSKTETVHAVVALAFIGPRPRGHDIHHIDGNPANNSVDNLVYVSRKKHFQLDRTGENHGRAKLSQGEVVEIRALYATGDYTYQSLADRFGVSIGSIAPIVKGAGWKNAPGIVTTKNIPKGKRHHNSKLDAAKVQQIRAMKQRGVKQKDIATHFGITTSVVSVILSGKAWKHVL